MYELVCVFYLGHPFFWIVWFGWLNRVQCERGQIRNARKKVKEIFFNLLNECKVYSDTNEWNVVGKVSVFMKVELCLLQMSNQRFLKKKKKRIFLLFFFFYFVCLLLLRCLFMVVVYLKFKNVNKQALLNIFQHVIQLIFYFIFLFSLHVIQQKNEKEFFSFLKLDVLYEKYWYKYIFLLKRTFCRFWNKCWIRCVLDYWNKWVKGLWNNTSTIFFSETLKQIDVCELL